jgi:hypothetical protein
MVTNVNNQTITAYPSVTEDGQFSYSSSKDRLVNVLQDFTLEGLTESSTSIIERYSLNSEPEVLSRLRENRLRDIAKSFEDDRGTIISVFSKALRNIMSLSRNSPQLVFGGENLLRSMLYANTITALESFLSDFLIQSISNSEEYLSNLGSNYRQFKERKLSLRELIDLKLTPLELAVKELENTVFHNMARTEYLYKAALGIGFPQYGKIASAVENRHDIVHRNGVRRGSRDPTEYSQQQVVELVLDVQMFVSELLETVPRSQDCEP